MRFNAFGKSGKNIVFLARATLKISICWHLYKTTGSVNQNWMSYNSTEEGDFGLSGDRIPEERGRPPQPQICY